MLRGTKERDFCRLHSGFLKGEATSTLPSPTTSHVLVAPPNERTLRFPIKLLVGTQIVETSALIDSGATGNFIDLGLLSLANFPLKRLPQPIGAFNIDGTPNRRGTILWKARTHIALPHGSDDLDLMVVRFGRKQIILGMPWLRSINPNIDWKSNTLSFPKPTTPNTDDDLTPQRYLLRWLGCDSDMELASLFSQRYSSEHDASLREHLPQKDLYCEHLNKITLSTELAQASKTPDQKIPDWCSDLEDIFSEKTHNVPPPHQSYDHTIDLKPSFVAKIAKVYPLNPKEQEACKAFINEHLKTGRIVPSKSPQAAPFFFVAKKDGSLRPCQDYRYLNSHTVHNTYPLPLIPELIDNMKDSTIFTKFDLRWGFNNICIHEEDQWKGAFITPFGLFEPTVMFFWFPQWPTYLPVFYEPYIR